MIIGIFIEIISLTILILFIRIRNGLIRDMKTCSGKTVGYLKEIREHIGCSDDDNVRRMYTGVYEYYINDYKYTIKGNISYSNKNNIKGKIELYYNPKNPNKVYFPGSIKVINITIIVILVIWLIILGALVFGIMV